MLEGHSQGANAYLRCPTSGSWLKYLSSKASLRVRHYDRLLSETVGSDSIGSVLDSGYARSLALGYAKYTIVVVIDVDHHLTNSLVVIRLQDETRACHLASTIALGLYCSRRQGRLRTI